MNVIPFIERSEKLSRLVDGDRIFESVTQLLGDGFLWGGSEGNVGSHNDTGDHIWHCDRAEMYGLEYGFVKYMICLEPTTKETGELRVISGSHLPPFV